MLAKIIVPIIAGLGAGLGTGIAGLSAAAVISPMLITFLDVEPYQAVGIAQHRLHRRGLFVLFHHFAFRGSNRLYKKFNSKQRSHHRLPRKSLTGRLEEFCCPLAPL